MVECELLFFKQQNLSFLKFYRTVVNDTLENEVSKANLTEKINSTQLWDNDVSNVKIAIWWIALDYEPLPK